MLNKKLIVTSLILFTVFQWINAKQHEKNLGLTELIIGRSFINNTSFSDSLFDNQEGFVCNENTNYTVKIYAHKSDKNRWYLLLIKGKQSPKETNFISDAIEINLKQSLVGSEIKWNTCKDQNDQNLQYIAVYVFKPKTAQPENKIVPENAWMVNAKTGKFDIVPVKRLKCNVDVDNDEE